MGLYARVCVRACARMCSHRSRATVLACLLAWPQAICPIWSPSLPCPRLPCHPVLQAPLPQLLQEPLLAPPHKVCVAYVVRLLVGCACDAGDGGKGLLSLLLLLRARLHHIVCPAFLCARCTEEDDDDVPPLRPMATAGEPDRIRIYVWSPYAFTTACSACHSWVGEHRCWICAG